MAWVTSEIPQKYMEHVILCSEQGHVMCICVTQANIMWYGINKGIKIMSIHYYYPFQVRYFTSSPLPVDFSVDGPLFWVNTGSLGTLHFGGPKSGLSCMCKFRESRSDVWKLSSTTNQLNIFQKRSTDGTCICQRHNVAIIDRKEWSWKGWLSPIPPFFSLAQLLSFVTQWITYPPI